MAPTIIDSGTANTTASINVNIGNNNANGTLAITKNVVSYTPNGGSIQAKGITPDISVPSQSMIKTSVSHKKTEADLRGHLESMPINATTDRSGILSLIKKWPENLQKDHQLIVAFTYLKGWGVFQSLQKIKTKRGK